MLKLCPTCSSSADLEAMFCSRCGVSIAHVEPIERGSAPRHPQVAAAASFRRQAAGIAASSDVQGEAEQSNDERTENDATGQVGLARRIGAMAGAMAGAMLRGALDGAMAGDDCAYRGSGPFGEVFLSADGKQVFTGVSKFGAPIYLIEGTDLKERGLFGRVLARLDGGKVRLGMGPWGEVIATIDGPRVYRGHSTWGQPIAYVPSGRSMLGVAAAYHLLRG